MDVKQYFKNKGLDVSIDIKEILFNKETKDVFVEFMLPDPVESKSFELLIYTIENFITSIIGSNKASTDYSISYSNQPSKKDYEAYYPILLRKKDLHNVFLNSQWRYIDATYEIEVSSVTDKLLALKEECKAFFLKYGFKAEFEFKIPNLKELEKQLEEQKKKSEEKIVGELLLQDKISARKEIVNSDAPFRKKETEGLRLKIIDLPITQGDLLDFANIHGEATKVRVQGEIFDKEVKQITVKRTQEKMDILSIRITDFEDSITIRKFIKQGDAQNLLELKEGDFIEVIGVLNFDAFSDKEVCIDARKITLLRHIVTKVPEDDAAFKRVEFHVHTNMSALDAITTANEYIELVEKWGHKAIAFTDMHGVYSFSEIQNACNKRNIKPIYGFETSLIDDIGFQVAYGEFDITLDNATYVVLDFETTGLSSDFDRLTEIGAVKIHRGEIVDEFNTLINPEIPIPLFIQEKTKITPAMVEGSPKIANVLPDLLKFIDGAIIVAQNADFDLGMLYANIKRTAGIKPQDYPAIDTMRLAMSFYFGELKSFNLKTLARYFGIKQEQHHRAYDDAKVTADIFISMLRLFKNRGIHHYNDINKAINRQEIYKYVFPYHANILVAQKEGVRNLFYLLSDSLTNHFHKEPRLPKSVFLSNREGLLIGSGCYNGEIFEIALNRSYDELLERLSFYDYIEVQPPSGYAHLASERDNGKVVIQNVIKKIIKACNEKGILVIASSNAHYLTEDLKEYREIYIEAPQLGGGIHDLKRYQVRPEQHIRSTSQMLAEMSFLGTEEAFTLVVKNTHILSDKIDKLKVFTNELFAPADDELQEVLGIDSIEEEVKGIVADVTKSTWGEQVPVIVSERIAIEMNSIIKNSFSANYYMTYLLVKKSNDDGYIVGSRGSVGSSYIATLMGISEVNPLPPHYRCPKCYFTAFKQKNDQSSIFCKELQEANSGYDLPDNFCPDCGTILSKEGQDIAFETFLGIAGDKIPDIDMNFSSVYQMQAHDYIRTLLGEDKTARAGTIISVADKTAYGYVLGYLRDRHITLHSAEVKRRAKYITGVRRSTGQHPGGIIVIPRRKDAYEITPFQYPSDKVDNEWQTTHFVYHSIEENLLKLDILGHDDPTTIRFLFDYVDAHPEDFPFASPEEIPLDDPNVYRFFCDTEVINVSAEELLSSVATYGIPEFGTKFVRELLNDTKPKNFSELVKISGLSHGKDIWLNNGQQLISGKTKHGTITFKEIIGCRDDIMDYLVDRGMEPVIAFEIMEFVRKGKSGEKTDPVKWEAYIAALRQSNIPEWYIWSCDRIKYLFPKAHAVAYVIMALRIAWFKYYKPLVFYSAFFSVRASQFEVETLLAGEGTIKRRIQELQQITKPTPKEDALLTMLGVALEMSKRHFKFLNVDINLSSATKFEIEDGALRLPFITLDGLGESVAKDIVLRREEQEFTSLADIQRRTKINKTVFEKMRALGAFGDIIEEEDNLLGGLFAF